MIKKLIFSVYQASGFIVQIFRGTAHFAPRIIECDWPHSQSRRRFFIIGVLDVHESALRIRLDGVLYPTTICPQRMFFQELDQGKIVESTSYYGLVTRLYHDVDFDEWFRDKLTLWENFRFDDSEFTPVAVRASKDIYIVEDGAHRLALKSLRGIENHLVGISLWSFCPS